MEGSGTEGRKEEGAAAAKPLNSVNGEVRRDSDAMDAVAPAIAIASCELEFTPVSLKEK